MTITTKETCDSCGRASIDRYGFCEECGHEQVFGSQFDDQQAAAREDSHDIEDALLMNLPHDA